MIQTNHNEKSLNLREGSVTYKVFDLFVRKGMDTQEVAKALDVDFNTAYKAIWHIKEKLKDMPSGTQNESEQISLISSAQPSETPAKALQVATMKEKHLSVQITPSMERYIPVETEKYISRKFFGKTDVKILECAYDSTPKEFVLLVGETGTGKTHCVRSFAAKKKVPYARINLNGGTSADELVGRWVPKADGGFKWQDGTLTEFVRHGGIIVLDEVNVCSAEILVSLHSLTDRERAIRLTDKDGELVKAHPNFFLVATMNPSGDYEGTKPLNWAFKDRFAIKLFFDYDKKIEEELIQDKEILNLANKLRTMRGSEIMSPISTRALMYFVRNKQELGDKLAFEIFLNNFDETEKKPIANVWEMLKHDDGKLNIKGEKSLEDGSL